MTTAEKSNQTGSGNTNSQQKSIKKKKGGQKGEREQVRIIPFDWRRIVNKGKKNTNST